MTTPKQVLIADDDQELARMLEVRLSRLGIEVSTVADGVGALAKIVNSPPDLFICDVNMPGANGLTVCEHILGKYREAFPIIVLTGESDAATKHRCRQIGARYVFKGSDTWEILRSMVVDLLGNPPLDVQAGEHLADQNGLEPQPVTAPRILLIDDDPQITQAIAIRLNGCGFETFQATSGMEGYSMALKHQPDVIITDYNMPDSGADYLIMRLQQGSTTSRIPVFVLTGKTLDGQQDHAFRRQILSKSGVVEFLAKPLDFDKLTDVLAMHTNLPKAQKQFAAAR